MVIAVRALSLGRIYRSAAGLIVLAAAQALLADPISPVYQPDAFRESMTADRLRELGFNPQEYQFQVPLGPLSVQRSYIRAGDSGMLSVGLAERATDVMRLVLNPRGTLEFTQDEARTEFRGLQLTDSRKRVLTLTQGFGKGVHAGTFLLSHTDTSAFDIGAGTSRSRLDKANLTVGLSKAFSLAAGAEESSSYLQTETGTRRYDLVLTHVGAPAPLFEYHDTTTWTGAAETDVRQYAVRTPTLKLGDQGTATASHVVTDSSAAGRSAVTSVAVAGTPVKDVSLTAGLTATSTAAGTDTVTNVAVASNLIEDVALTANHTATSREAGADSAVTAVGAQIKVDPETTVSASYTGTQVDGAPTTTQRSVTVTNAPADGKGLGVQAAYTETDITNTEVRPTIDVKLTYARPDQLEVSGRYHDDNARLDPEVGAGVKLAVLGGSVGLTYSENAFDPSLNAVRVARVWGAEVSRPIAWGLSGKFGYQRTDSLADPTVSDRLHVGVGGQTDLLGQVDVQYETGQVRTTAGTTPSGSTIALSVARRIGKAELALSGKHVVPPGPSDLVRPTDEVRVDLKAAW
jgi:hypothetical protein